ncbi:hypothetical protein BASA61_007325 [Batrachochytrium salamandrivorans]|nr:hypothetical protein BASA61_007325 [Batrachochytrium salamandrivorans]KAH9248123.1 hypothetical protein BASA81_014243 [Batrachochytrium salamandrivorans]KAH9274101.1 hypothetical protein BASA83_003403 [Batrachochytrium salamandrivorans]
MCPSSNVSDQSQSDSQTDSQSDSQHTVLKQQQDRQTNAHNHDQKHRLHGHEPPKSAVVPHWDSYSAILVHAASGGMRSFLISFALRGGITLAIRLFRVLRGKDLLRKAILSFFNSDSHRFARMVGSFSFIWKLINNSLTRYRSVSCPPNTPMSPATTARLSKTNGAIAGAVAGLAILFETPDNRIAYSQQFFMRSMQAGYNALSSREIFVFPHGDTILFSIACGSIMYAYVMHPTTIPKSYYSWMVKTARVPGDILDFHRINVKNWESQTDLVVSTSKIDTLLKKFNANKDARPFLMSYLDGHNGTMPTCPCKLLHPSDILCARYGALLWVKVFWGILPVHGSLNGVPLLLLKTKSFLNNPKSHAIRVLTSSLRSSAFLATFVYLFQTGICLIRKMRPNTPDFRYIYHILGAMAGLAVLLEHPSRRTELAMYCLPKGIQSLYTLLINRGRMVSLKGLDVIGACCAMSVLMGVYQVEPHQMSFMMYRLMRGILGTY